MEAIPVGEVMLRGVITCRPEMKLLEVVRLMAEADVGTMVVVDEQGMMQGLISRFDLLPYVGQDLKAVEAREAMGAEPLLVLATDTLAEVARYMVEKRVHYVVVADPERVHALAVVSAADVVNAMRRFGP